MLTDFVITAIGDDRPGLVEQLASVIRRHQGNWLESSMTHLAGKFAGIVRVSVTADQAKALEFALADMPHLRIVAELSSNEPPAAPARMMQLTLVGHDRMGIVQEVSSILARFKVNVEDLSTRTSSAPMSGETMFHAEARLAVAPETDLRVLQETLEALSNELFVEIALADD